MCILIALNRHCIVAKWVYFDELGVYRDHPDVADVRVLGAIGVVEARQAVDVAMAQKAYIDAGVWIRPFGKLIYLMPPYVISTDELTKLTTAIKEAI